MGVDISVYVEYKDKTDGKWKNVADHMNSVILIPPYDGRDYGLFGLLAGVRSSSGSLVLPRGLPYDLSYSVFKEHELGKDMYFGETWYDFNELSELSEAYYGFANLLRNNLSVFDDDGYGDCWDLNFCGVEIPMNIRYNIAQFESLRDFMRDIQTYCKYHGFGNIDSDNTVPGDFRIIMWFDC